MDEEIRLGFHRLGRRLEDPFYLGLALAFAWAIAVLLVSIAIALTFWQALLLVVMGVAVLLLLREQIRDGADELRQRRNRLEHHHAEQTAQ
jgi:hypothetical protein